MKAPCQSNSATLRSLYLWSRYGNLGVVYRKMKLNATGVAERIRTRGVTSGGRGHGSPESREFQERNVSLNAAVRVQETGAST